MVEILRFFEELIRIRHMCEALVQILHTSGIINIRIWSTNFTFGKCSELVTDIQVNVYIGNMLSRLSFQNRRLLKIKWSYHNYFSAYL